MIVFSRRFATDAAAVVLLAALYACSDAPANEQAGQAHDDHGAAEMAAGAEAEDLASVRRVTAGFGDIAAARAAGYTEQITSCWYHRERGGQGYHYGRTDLIDGAVSLLEPELVMYEPLADGTLEFIGIEYIVPFAAWTQPEPPALLGRSFMRNEQLELYVLHVWLGKENPNGIYADWNPNVSCTHATESEDRA
jgi:hypothetical protein